MSIESRFAEYDRLNPKVWLLFEKFAFRSIQRGRKRVSAKMITERIRWETYIETVGDEPYKINNSFTAYYARKFEALYPVHAGIFETRALRSDERIAA
jgi:hypothetical protein